MDLLAKLTEDMKLAMKSGQKDRLGVIRMLISEVKNVDLNPAKPTPQQAVETYAKKLRKSLEEYERLGKTDEVAKLRLELSVAEEYLPKKLDADATAKLVEQFLATNAFTEKQFGQAMGAFMKQHGGEVDAAIANRVLKEKLAGR
jgi:uncharacterized protein YqeY